MIGTMYNYTQTLKNWGKMVREEATAKGVDTGVYAQARMEKLIEEKKIVPAEFSFRAAFDAFVNPNGELHLDDSKEVAKAIEASLYPRITQPMVTALVKSGYDYEIGDLLSLFTQQDATHSMYEDIVGLNGISDLQYRKTGEGYERGSMLDEIYRFWYKDFGIIMDLLMEDVMDDKNNLIVRKASIGGEAQGKLLAQILCQSIEMGNTRTAFNESAAYSNTAFTRNGVSHFGHGTGSTAITGGSYPFYATVTHSGIDGQTNVNSIPDTFGSDGVKVANQYLATMTDPKGRAVKLLSKVLIGHSFLNQEMMEFVSASNRYDTLEPTPNVYRGKLGVVTSPYFTSTTRWFTGDPAREALVRWVERPNTVSHTGLTDANFERRVVMSFRHNMYLGTAHTDYRYLISCGVTP